MKLTELLPLKVYPLAYSNKFSFMESFLDDHGLHCLSNAKNAYDTVTLQVTVPYIRAAAQ